MDGLRENWFWLLTAIFFVGMHLWHGHGGHRGHDAEPGEREDRDRERHPPHPRDQGGSNAQP